MIKNELKEAKKELLQVRTKNALRVTTKAVAILLTFVLPPVGIGFGLGKYAGGNSCYYEKVYVDSNGNEESLGLVNRKANNRIRVYTSCNETEDGYVKTYDEYSKEDVDSTVFSYIHNKDDLGIMLGTPIDTGYEIDDVKIDLDTDYARITEYRKTNIKRENVIDGAALIVGGMIGLGLDLSVGRIIVAAGLFDKIDNKFNNVDGWDVSQAKKKVKRLKKEMKS